MQFQFQLSQKPKQSVFTLICITISGRISPWGRKHVSMQRWWQIRKTATATRVSSSTDANLFADKHIGVERVIASLFTFRLHGLAVALSHDREFPNRVARRGRTSILPPCENNDVTQVSPSWNYRRTFRKWRWRWFWLGMGGTYLLT